MRYILACFLSLMWFGSAFADLAGYTIEDYHVDMVLSGDGSMSVVESLDVNFDEERHGIYREIPLQDPYGEQLSLSNVSVDVDPLASQSWSNNFLTLKIGDKDTTIIWPKRYTIRYTVDNAIKIYSGWTELYRNVIGDKRETTIAKSSRSLQLPKEYSPDSSWTFAVWWSYGETLTGSILFASSSNTQRDWSLSSELNPYQWVTIGMKFPSDYFVFPDAYEEFFISSSDDYEGDNTILSSIIGMLFWLVFIFGIPFFFSSYSKKRKSNRPVTIYYNPPKGIDVSLAFFLWHNNEYEPKIFTALLYYRAAQWWAVIKKEKTEWLFWFFASDQYHIIETSNKPLHATDIDRTLLQKFFGTFDNVKDDIALSEKSYTTIKSLLSKLSTSFLSENYTKKKEWWQWFFGIRELTDSWKDIFEQLRWYKEYLSKVERPVIEQELKSDPDFINKILPWAVLFGVETRLLKMIEDLLRNLKRYQSNDGTYLTYATLNSMNNSFKSYSTPPRSSSSSWFSGWWWFSGGWGWWGGWWSW